MLLRSLALLACVPGCFLLDGDDDTLPDCKVLDEASFMLVASDPTSNISDIGDGSQVALIAAPQGGHILLVGARVKTANDCKLTATAALRDTSTHRVLGLEQRPLLLEMRHDGWAVPRAGLDAMPNVAVCPSAAATTPIYDHEYRLEMLLANDAGESIAEMHAMIMPTCGGSQHCHHDCGLTP